MIDSWYFANKNQPVGPFKLAELKALLEQVANWEGLMVWGTGFSEWRRAESVQEILALFETPPPIPAISASEFRKDQSEKSSGWTVAKILLGIALLAAAAMGGAFGKILVQGVQDFLTAPSSSTTALDLEKGLASASVKIRIDLPKKIDATTVLTGVRNERTTMIFENLIVTDGNKFDDAMKDKLRQSVIKNVCGNAETRSILDIGGSFRYLYVDIEAKPVVTIDIFQRTCS
jgi:GYF domain 2